MNELESKYVRGAIDIFFPRILAEYGYVLDDKDKLTWVLNELFHDNSFETKLLLILYDLGIHKEIKQPVELDNALIFRFVERLRIEYSVSKEDAEWAVNTWCSGYSKVLANKKAEMVENIESDNYSINEYIKKYLDLQRSISEITLENSQDI